MAERNVRDLLIEAWRGLLLEERCSPTAAARIARRLAQVAEDHGVRLARPAYLHDPVATDYLPGRSPAAGDSAAGVAVVRGELRELRGTAPRAARASGAGPPGAPAAGTTVTSENKGENNP